MPTVKDLRDFCRLADLPCASASVKADLVAKVSAYLRAYHFPKRYLDGLTRDEAWEKKFELRYNELRERHGASASYARVPSDEHHATSRSAYTARWLAKYPHATSLAAQSKVSGVPVDVLQRVYDKGLAAWRGGHHRPGAAQHAWAMARVHSFLTKGKTFSTADHTLAEEAMDRSAKARRFWS